MGFAALFVSFIVISAVPAAAQQPLRGVALVIGNGNYEHLPPLTNPAHDARAVERLLSDLGFETEISSDRDARRLSRDLRDFVEDAEGADVAIVYFAGHGIEAGGENFLVPVDADLSALDAAGEKLVPISGFMQELQSTVPVAILLLDACRDNPFPAGALVRLEQGGEALPMGDGGLGETRGARAMTAPQPGVESFGTVIGFAAEPGKVALDGAPGENSPYAAAVLRHIETMAGEEFGLVMRMVAEEVYLKTGGAQRPWVNESLRRLLYLGAAPEPVAGEEGDILAERRRLLVSIAELPQSQRRQVEAVAADGDVPMDALYAMLGALGQDAPGDPAELDRLLRGQAERVREMIAHRQALTSSDAEIARLADLAATALSEGALQTAIALNEKAKARVGELATVIEDAEAQVKARRTEFAAVYERSADAYALAFRYDEAAADYARAFAEIERWDDALAWRYKLSEARMHGEAGTMRSNRDLVRASVAAIENGLRLADRQTNPTRWATTQSMLGGYLSALADMDGDRDAARRSIEAYQNALSVFDREQHPDAWAIAMHNYALALSVRGDREADLDTMHLAAETYRSLIDSGLDLSEAGSRGTILGNYASALTHLGIRENSAARLAEAVDKHRAALEAMDRGLVPQSWAIRRFSLGNAIYALASATGDTQAMRDALPAYDDALEEFTRDRFPGYWAKIQNNLTAVLREIGESTADTGTLREALKASDNVLSVITREAAALEWADAMLNRAGVLARIGEFERDRSWLEQAVAVNKATLDVYTEADFPLDHAKVTLNLAVVELALAELEEGTAALERSIAFYRKTRAATAQAAYSYELRSSVSGLGRALTMLGERSAEQAHLVEAVGLFEEALTIVDRAGLPRDWAALQYRYALAEIAKANAGDAEAGQRAIERIDLAQSVFTQADQPEMYRRLQTARGEAMALSAGPDADHDDHRATFQTLESAMPPAPPPGQELVWAALQAMMADGYTKLAERSMLADDVDKAMHYRQTAVGAYAEHGSDHDRGMAQLGLARTVQLRGRIRSDAADFDVAATAYRAAAGSIDAGADHDSWVGAHEGLGYVQMSLGNWTGDAGRYEEAAAAYRTALAARDKGADIYGWLDAQNHLAMTLLGLGKAKADHGLVLEARTIWSMVLGDLKANGIEGNDDYIASLIGQAEAAMAELQ